MFDVYAENSGEKVRRAFTLVELLAVVAILAVLSALVLSVIGNSKRAARQAATTSNLHQTWVALSLYAEENGGWATGDSAREAVRKAPTCDPTDTWRSSCAEILGDPMLGSYAYAYNVPLFRAEPSALTEFLASNPNPGLLVSLFPEERKTVRFVGERPPVAACRPLSLCVMPPHVLVARLDGSVRRASAGPQAVEPTGSYPLITWSSLFYAVSKP